MDAIYEAGLWILLAAGLIAIMWMIDDSNKGIKDLKDSIQRIEKRLKK